MLLRWILALAVLGMSSWKCAADTILCDTTEDCPETTKNCILQRNLFTYDFGKFLPFPNVMSEAAKEKTGCLMILQDDPDVVARNGIPDGAPSTISWSYVTMFSFPYCAPGSKQPEVAHQSITWESKRRGSGPLYILRGLKETANDANLVQGETLWKLNDDGTEIQIPLVTPFATVVDLRFPSPLKNAVGGISAETISAWKGGEESEDFTRQLSMNFVYSSRTKMCKASDTDPLVT